MKRKSRSPDFSERIARLRLRLQPIHPLPHGLPHPSFPKTILHYYLLTESQLDSIAHYYSQSTPNEYTTSYPVIMGWDREFLEGPELSHGERVAVKRRKVGKFIGLRGCETPIEEVARRIKALEERLEREVEQEKEARGAKLGHFSRL